MWKYSMGSQIKRVRKVCYIWWNRDYYQRLRELLLSFDSISSQTRFETSDLDTSAKARKQSYKAQEKEAKSKKQKLNDNSVIEV